MTRRPTPDDFWRETYRGSPSSRHPDSPPSAEACDPQRAAPGVRYGLIALAVGLGLLLLIASGVSLLQLGRMNDRYGKLNDRLTAIERWTGIDGDQKVTRSLKLSVSFAELYKFGGVAWFESRWQGSATPEFHVVDDGGLVVGVLMRRIPRGSQGELLQVAFRVDPIRLRDLLAAGGPVTQNGVVGVLTMQGGDLELLSGPQPVLR